MIPNGRRPVRLAAASTLIGVVLAGVGLRLCQLALVDGDRLATIAERQHSETQQVMPLRGSILDRAGEPLAMSIDADSVFVRPSELPADGSAAAVARVLDIPSSRWLKKISSPARFTWVKRQASPDQLERLRELNVPGVGTLPEHRRFYPHGRMAAPVLGFAGVDSQGLEGIELAYDSFLRGSASEVRVDRDARGRRYFGGGVATEPPHQGSNVELTLDATLQYAAERELEKRVTETHAKGGLVIVLDPRRGEVLALAQNPTFDPNRREHVTADLLRNRAVADSYEPGSTMKGLLVAAALDHGAVKSSDRFFCENGNYPFAGHVIHDHHGAGWLTVPEILQVSSNIGATKIGQRLGAKSYYQTLRAFGLGSQTGIDLSGEQGGIVRPLPDWKPIDLATASFGQGIAVTPIQLAAAYGAIANGGILMKPFVVKRVVDEDGDVITENQPTVVRRVVERTSAQEVTGILERVLTPKGTAPLAAIPGLRIAGKTGTAQKVDPVHGGYSRGRIASFIGFFPAEDPQVVMLVVIDEPRTTIWGGTAAAPVFRAVALAAAERLGLHVDAVDPATDVAAKPVTEAALEDADESTSFLGLSLREAVERARAEGLTIEVVGSGYVVEQSPAPGPTLDPAKPIRLKLAPAGESVG